MVQWCNGRWPRTKISEDVKHTFAWTIERFSERQEPNSQFLWSSKFTIRGPDEQVGPGDLREPSTVGNSSLSLGCSPEGSK